MSGGFQWLALVAALLAIVIVAEAWLGHYRSGFPLRVQHVPLVIGGILAIASVAVAAAPANAWVHGGLRVTAWIAIPIGVVGVGYHHWFGVIEKAGGYRFLLHYLMYGAPQLAPLAPRRSAFWRSSPNVDWRAAPRWEASTSGACCTERWRSRSSARFSSLR